MVQSYTNRISAVFRCLLGIALLCAMGMPCRAVPSFARQTGMACAACHTVFPELTPFGREFKLNGYVLDNMKQVTGIDTSANQTLALNSIPPISLMLQVSYTRTGKALPDSAVSGALAKDGDLLFPQQVSFFYAGKIADGLGAFVQLTYDGAEDHFGFDNTDVRYAHHWSFGGSNENDHSLILGVTLNNNPTVQDRMEHHAGLGVPVFQQQYRTHSDQLGENRQRGGWLWAERGRPRRLCLAGQPLLRRDHGLHLGHHRRRPPAGQHTGQRGACVGSLLALGV